MPAFVHVGDTLRVFVCVCMCVNGGAKPLIGITTIRYVQTNQNAQHKYLKEKCPRSTLRSFIIAQVNSTTHRTYNKHKCVCVIPISTTHMMIIIITIITNSGFRNGEDVYCIMNTLNMFIELSIRRRPVSIYFLNQLDCHEVRHVFSR